MTDAGEGCAATEQREIGYPLGGNMNEMDALFPVPTGQRNADDMGMPLASTPPMCDCGGFSTTDGQQHANWCKVAKPTATPPACDDFKAGAFGQSNVFQCASCGRTWAEHRTRTAATPPAECPKYPRGCTCESPRHCKDATPPAAAPAAQDAELIATLREVAPAVADGSKSWCEIAADRLAALTEQVAALTRERDEAIEAQDWTEKGNGEYRQLLRQAEANITQANLERDGYALRANSAEARCAAMERDVAALKWLIDTMMSIPTMTDEQLTVLRGEAESIVARAALAAKEGK
jgi:hypothetical protein